MQTIQYAIRYENQTVEKDSIDLYDEKISREKLAIDLAQSYLLSEVYDIEGEGPEVKLGEAIPCQIGRNLWHIQFSHPFCPTTEDVTVRFIS